MHPANSLRSTLLGMAVSREHRVELNQRQQQSAEALAIQVREEATRRRLREEAKQRFDEAEEAERKRGQLPSEVIEELRLEAEEKVEVALLEDRLCMHELAQAKERALDDELQTRMSHRTHPADSPLAPCCSPSHILLSPCLSLLHCISLCRVCSCACQRGAGPAARRRQGEAEESRLAAHTSQVSSAHSKEHACRCPLSRIRLMLL